MAARYRKARAETEALSATAAEVRAGLLADPPEIPCKYFYDDAGSRLFDEIAPRFANRPGGYTRVLKLGPRMGDSAEMVILELVEE